MAEMRTLISFATKLSKIEMKPKQTNITVAPRVENTQERHQHPQTEHNEWSGNILVPIRI